MDLVSVLEACATYSFKSVSSFYRS
jgi:hypothetical protein